VFATPVEPERDHHSQEDLRGSSSAAHCPHP